MSVFFTLSIDEGE